MNNITVVGLVGQVHKIKQVSNSKVLNFSLVESHFIKDKNIPVWYNCQVWGNYADTLVKNIKKGQKVAVSGKLFIREYEQGKTSNDINCLFVELPIVAKEGNFKDEVKEVVTENNSNKAPENTDDLPFS